MKPHDCIDWPASEIEVRLTPRLGETWGRNRVYRLMKREALRAQVGYRRRAGPRGGLPAVTAPNRLEQRFDVTKPNKAWVTDITYIGPTKAGCTCRRHRPLLAQCDRLVDGVEDRSQLGLGCIVDGRLASATEGHGRGGLPLEQ